MWTVARSGAQSPDVYWQCAGRVVRCIGPLPGQHDRAACRAPQYSDTHGFEPTPLTGSAGVERVRCTFVPRRPSRDARQRRAGVHVETSLIASAARKKRRIHDKLIPAPQGFTRPYCTSSVPDSAAPARFRCGRVSSTWGLPRATTCSPGFRRANAMCCAFSLLGNSEIHVRSA